MARPRKQSSLDSRVAAIAQQMAAELVRAVRTHLADEVAKVIGGRRGGTAVPKGHTTFRRRGRGVGDAVLAQLLKAIKAAPGLRSEQIYKKVSVPPKTAKAGLAKLRKQKHVKLRGQRRGAKYFAAT